METIKITSKRVKETAEIVINGNTVYLQYEHNDDAPQQVQFSVARGVVDSEGFTGQQELGGSLEKNANFSSYNLGNRKKGDGALLDAIYEVCEQIVSGTIKKEEANESSN